MIQVSPKISRAQPADALLPIHHFSVADYHRMIDAGILTTSDKVELLEGWIVDKLPQNPPRMTAIARLQRWLGKLLSEDEWTVRVQGPITLQDSEPEPDVVVARGPDTRYERRHPGAGDIVLAIEVSDSSLMEERRNKGALYAAAKIGQFWLINLQSKHTEIYSNPQGGRDPLYRNRVELSSADAVSLVLDKKQYGEVMVKHLLS